MQIVVTELSTELSGPLIYLAMSKIRDASNTPELNCYHCYNSHEL